MFLIFYQNCKRLILVHNYLDIPFLWHLRVGYEEFSWAIRNIVTIDLDRSRLISIRIGFTAHTDIEYT